MLFYIVLCVYFLALLAPNIETNELSSEEKPEPIFVDVIKNITRVNNELQALIKNYKQIKKKTYSQDDFEVKENLEDKKILPELNATTSSYPTQMFIEEQGEKNSDAENNSPEENSSEEEKSQESKKPTTEKSKSHEIEKKQTDDKEVKVQKNISDKSNETEELIEPIDSANSKEKPMKPKDRQRSKDKPSEPNHTILPEDKSIELKESTYSKEKSIEPKGPKYPKETSTEPKDPTPSKEEIEEGKKPIMPEILSLQNKGRATKKTRYSVKGTQTSSSSPSSKGKLYVKSEEEDVHASKVKERSKEVKPSPFTAGIYLRIGNGSHTTKKPVNGSFEDSSDTDEELSKDMMKTSALREAYGEACQKMVIKKCYKACKKTLKHSLRAVSIKGKSDMKSYFKKHYKSKCEKAFGKNVNSTTAVRTGIVSAEGVSNSSLTKDDLTPACLTRMAAPTLEIPTNETVVQNGNATKEEGLNILRDKYEKACQKLSRKKCKTACRGAAESTCNKYECVKGLKKRFNRNCKKQCKILFSVSSKGRSSSGSSSRSDSGSGSDSGSDSRSDSSSSSSGTD